MIKIASLVLLVMISICSGAHGQELAAISFVNRDSVHDFGRVARREVIRYTFEIRNTGSVPLMITDISSKNKDLKFEWPKQPLKPRKKELIYVTYSPGELTDIGSVNSTILISSNATPESHTFIHVSSVVAPPMLEELSTPQQEHIDNRTPEKN